MENERIVKKKRGRPPKSRVVDFGWKSLPLEERSRIIWTLQDSYKEGYLNIFTNIILQDGIVKCTGYLGNTSGDGVPLSATL